jgi:hypothetical protein
MIDGLGGGILNHCGIVRYAVLDARIALQVTQLNGRSMHKSGDRYDIIDTATLNKPTP